MRVGQNPAKAIEQVAQPAPVTVAVVNYIPFLSGYYAQSLEVLQACLESIWTNTQGDYDLLVFDNASCPEVRAYLSRLRDEGRIQYLVLSERNIGKGGAWNFIFGAAPGEFVAYADSDVRFHPGWLPAHLQAFDQFPNLGMLTGAPLRVPEEFSTSTVRWAESTPGVELERGVLLSWEDWWKHAVSLGVETEAEGRQLYAANQDVRLACGDRRYYIGAAHFQFVARSEVLRSMLPIPSERPMGQVRSLDIAINEAGLLRLSTPEWWVEHMGNRLSEEQGPYSTKGEYSVSLTNRLLDSPLVRRSLLKLYDRIFRLYFARQ